MEGEKGGWLLHHTVITDEDLHISELLKETEMEQEVGSYQNRLNGRLGKSKKKKTF